MVKETLVTHVIETGQKMLAALDAAGLAVSVALFLYAEEYEEWRFVVASRILDDAGVMAGYRLVGNALRAAGISSADRPTFTIPKMNDPFIRALRRTFAKTKSVEGMRLGLQTIGDRFVEDAWVYRIR